MQLTVALDPATGAWALAVDGDWTAASPAADLPRVDLPGVDLSAGDSLRAVAAVLESGDTLGLVARRPAGARGHDRDELAVVLTGEHAHGTVFDPRLSTEYVENGTPRRFGVELWIGTDPEGEQHPLRMAGEADGPPPEPLPHGIHVHPMHAHAAHAVGRAVYLLISGATA